MSLCECGCGRETNIIKVSNAKKGLVKGRPRRFIWGHGNRNLNPSKCSVEGCLRDSIKKGWCEKHYTRWKNHGDPLMLIRVCLRNGSRRSQTSSGYSLILDREHNRAMQNGYVSEGIFMAEKALGKPLPCGSEVHHVNCKKNDNSIGNLVVCHNRGYHMLLHQRTRALAACGHAGWIKCAYCKQYDDPSKMYMRKNKPQGWHKECNNKYFRLRRISHE